MAHFVILGRSLTGTCCSHSSNTQGKKAVFLRFSKVAGKKCITTVSKEIVRKKVEMTMGEFQTQTPQRLVDRYKHMNSRNERWLMRLKLIQEEYYFIGNQKS